jgi:hypothetical protein
MVTLHLPIDAPDFYPNKSKSRLSHRAWKSRIVRGIPTFPQPRLLLVNYETGHIVC